MHRSKKSLRRRLALSALLFLIVCGGAALASDGAAVSGDGEKAAEETAEPKTRFSFRGYVKVDVALTDFDSGSLPTNSLGRDFYIPALVPVGGDGSGPVFDFNPRETRFMFDLETRQGDHVIQGHIELDFQVTTDGNERISNSYTPRMRQAYLKFGNWMFGQAWSTFQNVRALPESLDFLGPSEGTVFDRQPMVRYRRGAFELAIEQPETEITGSSGERLLPGTDALPDLIGRYTSKGDWGHVTVAGLVRRLEMEAELVPGGQEDSILGYGVSVAGRLDCGDDGDWFKFMVTGGDGIGRYVGLNVVDDATIDAAGELELIGLVAGFASYRHVWNDDWRSNFTVGYFQSDVPVDFTGTGVAAEVYSVRANLIRRLSENLNVGVEISHAERELESGVDGGFDRLQLSARYDF